MAISDQRLLYILGISLLCVLAVNFILRQRDKKRACQLKNNLKILPQLPSSELVSVLVAAWNEEEHILKHIESFLNLRYEQKELIICAGGDDNTLEIAKHYINTQVRVVEQFPGDGKQKALKRCYDMSKGSILFFTDADCYLDDASFSQTLLPIISEGENITTGNTQPALEQMHNAFIASQAVIQIYSAIHADKYVHGILGRNAAVRRTVLEETKALDVEAPTGTDYALAKTLLMSGAYIRYVPGSLIKTDYHSGISDYIHQQWRWAKNVFFLGKQFGAQDEVRKVFINAVVGVIMLLLPFSFLVGLDSFLTIWLVLFFHGIVSRWRYIETVRKAFGLSMPRGIVFFQPLMLLIDFFSWARPLPNYIFKTRKACW